MKVMKIIYSLLIISFFSVSDLRGDNSVVLIKDYTSSFSLKAEQLYDQLQGPYQKPDYKVFENAIRGYQILSVIDFSLHSREKRLWVIDVDKAKILYHTWVAHGKNTGMAFAKKFSNIPHSNQSSLGFYLTAETYYGKHGLSLRLDGIDKSFNDNARKRNIVIHGAKYANPAFVKKYGRLGRSFGCPAIPTALHKEIINEIKEQSVLFIHYPDKNYYKRSDYININKVRL